MRDKLGRFTVGHVALPGRNPLNGRFISGPESRYRQTRYEVDLFLAGGGGGV